MCLLQNWLSCLSGTALLLLFMLDKRILFILHAYLVIVKLLFHHYLISANALSLAISSANLSPKSSLFTACILPA